MTKKPKRPSGKEPELAIVVLGSGEGGDFLPDFDPWLEHDDLEMEGGNFDGEF